MYIRFFDEQVAGILSGRWIGEVHDSVSKGYATWVYGESFAEGLCPLPPYISEISEGEIFCDNILCTNQIYIPLFNETESL
jgi:hypothetical protein